MSSGFNRPFRKDSTERRAETGRSRSTSLAVGGAILAAAIAALIAYGGGPSRDVDATATTATRSPPTDRPTVSEPTRPTLLPNQVPPK